MQSARQKFILNKKDYEKYNIYNFHINDLMGAWKQEIIHCDKLISTFSTLDKSKLSLELHDDVLKFHEIFKTSLQKFRAIHENDYHKNMTFGALNLLKNGYINLENGETPYDMIERIAIFAASIFPQESREQKFVEYMREMLNYNILPSSPILYNIGKKKNKGFASCFIYSITNDEFEDINILMSKIYNSLLQDGGVAISIDRLHYDSWNTFLNYLNNILYYLNRNEEKTLKRKAFLNIYVSDHHPLWLNVIQYKIYNRDTNINTCLMLSANTCNAIMDSNAEYNTIIVSPNTPNYNKFLKQEINIDSIDNHYKSNGVSLLKLFGELEAAWRSTGQPSLINKTCFNNPRVEGNRWGPNKYIESSNLCTEIIQPPNTCCTLGTVNVYSTKNIKYSSYILTEMLTCIVVKMNNQNVAAAAAPPLGIGICGLDDLLERDTNWLVTDAMNRVNYKIMEQLQAGALEASCKIGKYFKWPCDKQYNDRLACHPALIALMPTTATSTILGVSPGILRRTKTIEFLDGNVPRLSLAPFHINRMTNPFDYQQQITEACIRQEFIDQSQMEEKRQIYAAPIGSIIITIRKKALGCHYMIKYSDTQICTTNGRTICIILIEDVYIEHFFHIIPNKVDVDTLHARLNKLNPNYNILSNNCEHMIRFMAYGIKESVQISALNNTQKILIKTLKKNLYD
ncbi:hypothetical protein PV326_001629 [Microctonus aethiopoides]|nr:hypothetical protein PV326_001629 [Microctonus aethiopoides]